MPELQRTLQEACMNPREVWISVIEMLMVAEGYLVLGSDEIYQVGDQVPDRFGLGISYRVQGEAKQKDARRQLELIEKFAGMTFVEPPVPPHFYKTVMVAN